MNGTTFKLVYQRILSKTDKIDILYRKVPEDLKERREIRDSWYRWHSVWKKAWLEGDATEEEKKSLREISSIQNRL